MSLHGPQMPTSRRSMGLSVCRTGRHRKALSHSWAQDGHSHRKDGVRSHQKDGVRCARNREGETFDKELERLHGFRVEGGARRWRTVLGGRGWSSVSSVRGSGPSPTSSGEPKLGPSAPNIFQNSNFDHDVQGS